MEQQQMPTIDEIAMWLGEKEINLRMAWKEIKRLKEENEKLKAGENED